MTSSAWFQTLVAMPRSERSALCWKASKQTKNGRQGRPVCCLLRCDSNLAVAFTEEHSVRVSPCKSQCIDLSTRECTPAQSFGWLIKSSFQCMLFLCVYLLVRSIANTLAWVRNGDRCVMFGASFKTQQDVRSWVRHGTGLFKRSLSCWSGACTYRPTPAGSPGSCVHLVLPSRRFCCILQRSPRRWGRSCAAAVCRQQGSC